MIDLEWTDRYGGPANWPDPETVCPGHCEGMGFYPEDNSAEWPPDSTPDAYGFVFVQCPTCGGSGKRPDLPPHA
jgi:hypothetical protein